MKKAAEWLLYAPAWHDGNLRAGDDSAFVR